MNLRPYHHEIPKGVEAVGHVEEGEGQVSGLHMCEVRNGKSCILWLDKRIAARVCEKGEDCVSVFPDAVPNFQKCRVFVVAMGLESKCLVMPW